MFVSKKDLEERIKKLEDNVNSLTLNQAKQVEVLLKQGEQLEQIKDCFISNNEAENKNLNFNSNLYPTMIEIHNQIGDGISLAEGCCTLYDTSKAVNLTLTINDSKIFPKKEVLKAVKEACEKAIKFFEV